MLFIFFFLFQSIGFAMKPAPFSIVEFSDEQSGLVLHSDPQKNTTTISKPSGEVIWKMEEYIGRKIIKISPDGSMLVLFGNEYFGRILSSNETLPVLVVYEKGKRVREFNFVQFFGMTIAEAKTRFLIPEMGGGWLGFMKYVELGEIDWKNRSISMSFQDETSHRISF